MTLYPTSQAIPVPMRPPMKKALHQLTGRSSLMMLMIQGMKSVVTRKWKDVGRGVRPHSRLKLRANDTCLPIFLRIPTVMSVRRPRCTSHPVTLKEDHPWSMQRSLGIMSQVTILLPNRTLKPVLMEIGSQWYLRMLPLIFDMFTPLHAVTLPTPHWQ